MSASVPRSPSALKSAVLVQGGGGHWPERQAKKASMSASVPMSPSQLKSAVPQSVAGSMVQNPADSSNPEPAATPVVTCPMVEESTSMPPALTSPPQATVYHESS